MEKITKQELKGHDAFVDKLYQWLSVGEKHFSKVISAAAAILIIGGGLAAYDYLQDNQEEKAQGILFLGESKFKEIQEGFEKAKNPPKPDPKAKKDDKKVEVTFAPPSGDMEKDYKDSLQHFREVIEKYPTSKAAVVASIMMGRIYFDHKKYDEVLPILEKAKNNSKHPVSTAILLDQIATIGEAKGNCQDSINKWAQIQSDPKMAALKSSAILKSGLCFEKLGQMDKAEMEYKKAEALNDDPEAQKTAKKYLKFLKRGKS